MMEEKKLFAVYLGGRADPDAVRRAKSELCQGLQTIHKDGVVLLDRVALDFDVDDVLELREIDHYYISLKPAAQAEKNLPVSAYIKYRH